MHLAGSTSTARTRGTTQKPGRPCLSFTSEPVQRGPGDQSPTRTRQRAHANLGQEQAHAVEVGDREGNRSGAPTENRESEDRIRATTPGNGLAAGPGRAKAVRVVTNLRRET